MIRYVRRNQSISRFAEVHSQGIFPIPLQNFRNIKKSQKINQKVNFCEPLYSHIVSTIIITVEQTLSTECTMKIR